jgi:hypothetical protein
MSRVSSQQAPVFLTDQLQPADLDLEACSHAAFQSQHGGTPNAARAAVAARPAAGVGVAAAGVGNIRAAFRALGGVLERAATRITSEVHPDAGTNPLPTISIARLVTGTELATTREQLIG